MCKFAKGVCYYRGMRIVFFETMPGEEAYFLTPGILPKGTQASFLPGPLCEDTVQQAITADVVSVFVKSTVTAAVLEALPNVKLVTTRSTGYDHIDIAAATAHGVKVANVPAYGPHTVAEFAFALMLTLSRKVYQAYDRLRRDGRYSTAQLGGFELFNKTLGVVGTGRIGRNVIAIAKGFGMQVVAFDTKTDEAFAQQAGFTYLPLPELLERSDIVTLHVPYLPATHHLINAEMFSHIKKGSYLINTSRGEVVDTAAMVAALDNGTLAGAGLDVLEGERDLKEEWELRGHPFRPADMQTLASDHKLIDRDNVIVTPHIAFETTEAMHEIMRVTAQTITHFATGVDQSYLAI